MPGIESDRWLDWRRLRERQVRLAWLLGRDEAMSVGELATEAPAALLLLALIVAALLL